MKGASHMSAEADKTIPVEQIIHDVIRELRELSKEESLRVAGLDIWTKRIKQKLAELAAQDQYPPLYVYGSSIARKIPEIMGGGEWLYDLCWLQYASKGNMPLLCMPLALESEWGNDEDIMNDFQKLLVSRADVRVMVFGEANKGTKITACKIGQQIKTFKGGDESDRYLLAGWDSGGFQLVLIDGAGTQLLTQY
jgi:hypothetical protein